MSTAHPWLKAHLKLQDLYLSTCLSIGRWECISINGRMLKTRICFTNAFFSQGFVYYFLFSEKIISEAIIVYAYTPISWGAQVGSRGLLMCSNFECNISLSYSGSRNILIIIFLVVFARKASVQPTLILLTSRKRPLEKNGASDLNSGTKHVLAEEQIVGPPGFQ